MNAFKTKFAQTHFKQQCKIKKYKKITLLKELY